MKNMIKVLAALLLVVVCQEAWGMKQRGFNVRGNRSQVFGKKAHLPQLQDNLQVKRLPQHQKVL